MQTGLFIAIWFNFALSDVNNNRLSMRLSSDDVEQKLAINLWHIDSDLLVEDSIRSIVRGNRFETLCNSNCFCWLLVYQLVLTFEVIRFFLQFAKALVLLSRSSHRVSLHNSFNLNSERKDRNERNCRRKKKKILRVIVMQIASLNCNIKF